MTRTVESPRGGATLSIESSDGVAYLRAANVVSEVTVPLRTNDLLAAVADELGSVGLMYLALAEHYGAEPSEDQWQVEALARLLWECAQNPSGPGDPFDETTEGDRTRYRNRARRLVARGVRVGGEGRG